MILLLLLLCSLSPLHSMEERQTHTHVGTNIGESFFFFWGGGTLSNKYYRNNRTYTIFIEAIKISVC